MIKTPLISIIAAAVMLSACDKTEQTSQKIPAPTSSTFELKVLNWGAQSTKVGTNPNIQPDGSMGLWIEVAGTQGLGEAQVIFGGQPALGTSVQERNVNAAISADQLTKEGNKEVSIKQLSTGKIYSVGTFVVVSEK